MKIHFLSTEKIHTNVRINRLQMRHSSISNSVNQQNRNVHIFRIFLLKKGRSKTTAMRETDFFDVEVLSEERRTGNVVLKVIFANVSNERLYEFDGRPARAAVVDCSTFNS
jgi:hypothetical protein